jgi:hypothetical protein
LRIWHGSRDAITAADVARLTPTPNPCAYSNNFADTFGGSAYLADRFA